MNVEKYYSLALRKFSPKVDARLSFTNVTYVSRYVRVVGAEGLRIVEMRKNVAFLGDFVEAYADACFIENCNMCVQLTQGFRLFDEQNRIVENATRVVFQNKYYDWDGYLRSSGEDSAFEVLETGQFLLILGSFSVPCNDIFYGEVESVSADAIETANGVCAVLMFRAAPNVSQILGHTTDELAVVCNRLERRQVMFLEEREANILLELYDVRSANVSSRREKNAPTRRIVVGLLGTQEALAIVPPPATLCDYSALTDPVARSLCISQQKSLASLRRSLANAAEDVVLTISRCEAAHLRWLEYDDSFSSSNEWQFALLVSEVDKLAWNQTLQTARKRERNDFCEREARLEFLEDRRRVRDRHDALVKAKRLRNLREDRVSECPEGGRLLGWRIVRYTRFTALLIREVELDAIEGDVSRPCDLSKEATIVANNLR